MTFDSNFKDIEQDMLIHGLHIKEYDYIINNVDKIESKKFQTTFNYFFKVRRNKEWRRIYYELFQEVYQDSSKQTFEYILTEIYKRTKVIKNNNGYIEASFASKMLHSVNPDKPIWDQYVLSYFDIVDVKKGDRIQECINNYKKIEEEYERLLNNEKVLELISRFRKIVTNYRLADMKIIDFMIWSNR